jgi:S-adenosylmethionine hydrolase
MPTPLITLTTDFGLADHYVGAMKGVILSRCPNATIVDVTHQIPPFSLYAGAYAIAQVAPYFPPHTVHVIVVDPGVGTARKPILARAAGHCFVCPDNGVLSFIYASDPNAQVREIANRDLWLPRPSATFHGRDIFAPSAAAVACGLDLRHVGPVLARPEVLSGLAPRHAEAGIWHGRVLTIDRFGNVITNFLPLRGASYRLVSPTTSVTRFLTTFGEAGEGVCFWYAGSSGYLEIGMNHASAAVRLNLEPGMELAVQVTID